MKLSALANSRLRVGLLFLLVFIGFNTVVRLGLAVFNGEIAMLARWHLAPALVGGIVFDVAVALWWSVPLALLLWLWPAARAGAIFRGAVALLVALTTLSMVFVAAAEFVFWNEFASRFNFIAVDYLVYTREVIGNIRESYSLGAMAGTILIVVLLLCAALARPFLRAAMLPAGSFKRRTQVFVAFLAATISTTALVQTGWKDALDQPQLVQLAGNGPWEFFHAFRYNEIDFQRFYPVLPDGEANALARGEFADRPYYQLTGSTDMPIERRVIPVGAVRKLNVVMVSVESLGAEFIESLGGKSGLTPNFERLGREGMLFRKLYATGTRTVRGLEALTLSVPPTPGHAIPMRPNNGGLFTLGGVLKSQGYDPLYLYGGYSYFDNMNTFFSGNGYTVIDRSAIAKTDITYENIWGVADEDLFRLAVREIDARALTGQKVFAHIMTTSNHRPFTYPPGRIDIPSGTSRDGAIKYTDYAIGKFIEEAKTKSWFDDTLFVFVGDHTSIGRGHADLATRRYHIPMVVYAPKWIKPETIDTIASQIDVAPSLLGLLNVEYVSQFFGRDIFRDGLADPHLYLAHYQTVGFIDASILIELKPRRDAHMYKLDTNERASGPEAEKARKEGIAFYQVAARRFSLHNLSKARPAS